MQVSEPASAVNELSIEMAEVIQEFLVESNEGLDRFDRDLIALEKDKNLARAAGQHLSRRPYHQGHRRSSGL